MSSRLTPKSIRSIAICLARLMSRFEKPTTPFPFAIAAAASDL